jgi:hypothetical protein
LLGLDAGDGAVLIVRLGGVLHFSNRHGCSNESQRTKTQDQGEYLVEHGLRRHLAEQVGRVGKVIGGAGSWILALPGRCVARNRRAVEVDDGLERATKVARVSTTGPATLGVATLPPTTQSWQWTQIGRR